MTTSSRLLRSPFGLGLLLLLCGGLLGGATPRDDVEAVLRARIEAARHGATDVLTTAGAPALQSQSMVVQYYQRTGFQSGWLGPNGPTPLVDSLTAVLHAAEADGLRPADYHVTAIDSLARRLRQQTQAGASLDEQSMADLDLLCTDAFLLYGAHLEGGRLSPDDLVPSWTLDRHHTDLPRRLQHALDTRTIRGSLHALRPPQPEYDNLRRALAHHRRLADRGGTPPLPNGPALKEGDRSARVPVLRRQLQATGDLAAPSPADPLLFDEPLQHAVGRFQERHGLTADGVVGPATRAALNVPAVSRIRKIEVNLERMRWLPRDLGTPHVMVNIADFWLRVVEDERSVLQMRVVVGTPYRQTPIFSDRISYLVFNPYWHVPHSIAVKDKLPDFKRNPALVSRLGFEVFQGWGTAAIDPSTIDWDGLSAPNFPYRLRQKPGPYNALGEVKFMFPNRHNVYLHDTPSRSLFNRGARGFSSGCIRVEHPVDLAAVLLRTNGGWTPDRVRTAMETNTERAVVLKQPVPVHLFYWTAWMENGTLHLRPDIYDRDAAVARALAAPLPPAERALSDTSRP